MYDALGTAPYTARRRPFLGLYIALLDLSADNFRIEKTTRNPRHYTVWGEPDALLRCVIMLTQAGDT